MTRLPGDRAINHGGVGWVEPACNPPLPGSGFDRPMENIRKRAARVNAAQEPDGKPETVFPGKPPPKGWRRIFVRG